MAIDVCQGPKCNLTFEETREKLLRFWSSLDNIVRLFISNDSIDYETISHFVFSELRRIDAVLRQTNADPNNPIPAITPEQINLNWFQNTLFPFLGMIEQRLLREKFSQEELDQYFQFQLFLENWSNLLDENYQETRELKHRIKYLVRGIWNQINLFKSIDELIREQNLQQYNLRQWNSFRPQGIELQKHYFDALKEKIESIKDEDLHLGVIDEVLAEETSQEEATKTETTEKTTENTQSTQN